MLAPSPLRSGLQAGADQPLASATGFWRRFASPLAARCPW